MTDHISTPLQPGFCHFLNDTPHLSFIKTLLDQIWFDMYQFSNTESKNKTSNIRNGNYLPDPFLERTELLLSVLYMK